MSTLNINQPPGNFDEIIDRVIARIIEIQQIIKPDKIESKSGGGRNDNAD